ncbi:MAG: sortase [Candidatus Peribacteraceae bacterium]|nr:sortase [Candidatus Peribacteraceae bacterium]
MRESRTQHLASYDSDGNIILRTMPSAPAPKEAPQQVPPLAAPSAPIPSWLEESGSTGMVQQSHNSAVQLTAIWTRARERMFSVTHAFMREGMHQYAWSFASMRTLLGKTPAALMRLSGKFRTFLLQPVWIIKPEKKPKKYSRITLFTLDVVRFGGTFATIFFVLFATLNYQSFWEILQEKANPLEHAQRVQEQTNAIDAQLKENLLRSPVLATAGNGADGSLLALLPPVGPPENRIIIPKLGLNVPLVTPSYRSLLNEDWVQVEKDIQDALAMGIVHYPGTARPGQAGNFFVTGHSSYYPWAPGKYKSVFARLHNLEPGDEYYVYYGGDQHRYIVRSKKEVSPSNVDVLDQPINKRLATLMTCTPVGTTLRRLVVIAEEVDPATGEVMAVGERQHQKQEFSRPAMLPI